VGALLVLIFAGVVVRALIPSKDSPPQAANTVILRTGTATSVPPPVTPTATLVPTSTPTPAPTATPTVVPVQLRNGAILFRGSGTGPHELTVKNGTVNDAVVKLINNQSGSLQVYVAVVRQSEWTIDGIPSGTYIVRFMAGIGWDQILGKFQKISNIEEFEKRIPFSIHDGLFDTWSITLNPVAGGTARTDSIELTKWDSQ
jgi:hypothetical protein